MINVIQEYQSKMPLLHVTSHGLTMNCIERQEKQSSARAVAFRKEMKTLFAVTRAKAQELSDLGIAAM
jgi:hypothetical protein